MAINEKKVQRMNDLIIQLKESTLELRASSLEKFAKKHKVSYNTVKKDAMILGYAVTPGFDLRNVPKSYRKEVRTIKEEIEKGKIDLISARSATYDYLMINPVTNVERLNQIYPLKDKHSLKIQKRVAIFTQQIAEERIKRGAHPVRAQAEAWRLVGNKIHNEIIKAMKTTPPEELEKMIKNIWDANFLKMQAETQYAKGEAEVINKLGWELKKTGEKGLSMPIWWRDFLTERYGEKAVKKMNPKQILQRMESDYKNVRRFQRPGKERKIPANFKESLKNVRKKQKFQEFAKAGRHLHLADKQWVKLKELEKKKLPKNLRTGKRKR